METRKPEEKHLIWGYGNPYLDAANGVPPGGGFGRAAAVGELMDGQRPSASVGGREVLP